MATTVKAFSSQVDDLIRSGAGLKALNAQAKADLLRTLPAETRALLTVYENAKRVYDGAAGDAMDWEAARALGARMDAFANRPTVPLELYNEGTPYKNGKEALGRMLDLFSGKSTSASPSMDAYTQALAAARAAASAKREALPLPEALHGRAFAQKDVEAFVAEHPDAPFSVDWQAAAFDQDAFDADYGRRTFGFKDKPLAYDDYQNMPHLSDDEARAFFKAAQVVGDAANSYASEDDLFKALDRPGWRWVERDYKRYRDLEATRAMAERTRAALNARTFLAYWDTAAPDLSKQANLLILRAYDAGTAGLDVEDNTRPSGEWSADNPHRKRAGEALGDTVRKQFAWEMEQGHWENVSNRALYESLSDKERQNILPLLSMARGEVKGPQFWADLWTRLATSADRTFGNPFRYLGSLAGDVSTPIGAWLTGRDFDYGKWAAGKKEQAKAEAMLIASTRRMTYGDYGILTEGILGTIEQLPIFAVTSAGAALAPATGGASVYGSAAFLALGYAEDTRQAALERGADPFAASLLGLASGAVQGAIDQIQWSQLAGLADSALLSVAKRNAAAAFSRSFAQGAVRRVGSAALLSAAQRVGSAYLTDVFLECAQEGLQGMTDSLTQDLALGLSGDASVDAKGALARALARFGEEFVQSLPTMLVTVGLAGGVRTVREPARAYSAGLALHDLRVGRAQTLPLIEAKGLNATGLRQSWRTVRGDAARVTMLTEALGSRNAAETAHAMFKAEETLANRHRTLAMQELVDMSSRALARFSGDPKAIQDMLRGLGLDATVTQAKLADTDPDGKAVSRGGFLVRLKVGGKTFDLGLRAATEAEVSLDATAASASSAWESLVKIDADVAKMGKDAFVAKWQADAAFRQGLTQKHRLASSGLFAVRPGLSVIVSRTNPETGAVERDTLPVGGLILLAQGGLSGEAVATNRSLAHETLHAITRLLRDGGVLTADGDLVKQARQVFGDPKAAGELFDEEAAATRLAEESGLGMEALDAVAGEVLRALPDKGVRGLLRRAAGAFMDWLAGGDVLPVVDREGNVTELSGDTRLLGARRDAAPRGRQFAVALADTLETHASAVSEAWGNLQAARAAQRQATLDALAREQVAKAPAPRREVTAAGPHANEPFTYAKSALRKRVDRAQMEGEGTNPIGKRDIVELTDIPPFWLDYGFQKGRLFTIADILRKIKKEHHIDASAFAELPEHYSRPVAILIQNEEWTILTDQLADDGTGRLAPVMLYVRQAKDGTNAYLASAYSRDVAGESAYINKANAGGLLYLDDIRIDALPLAGETKKALLEKWHSGKRTGAPFGPQEELNRSIQTSGESAFTSDNQGNTNTIAQPRANVNPQAAFDEARRRLEVSALYYGRSPEAAELSDRAIAEFAVAEEAVRSGKKPTQAQVSQAFRDFGLHPGEQSGRSMRRTLKLLNDLGLAFDDEGNAVAVPKGTLAKLASGNERLRAAFDSVWSEAEQEAFSKGAAASFAAAREMAAESQSLAKAHRDEAEAVLGMDPGILQTELGFDIEATLLADKAKWQKLTPAQAEAAAKKREEERQKAIEEAETAAQALQDGTPPREPSLEELGLDEAGIAKLRERRDELRKRWAEIDREAEAKRLERKLKREAEALDKEDDKEDDKDALLARKLERLKGVAFDIDDPVSVREFVNLVILHVAERRAGTTFAAPVQFNRQLTDPLTVRDAARTLAQTLVEMADRLAYGAARERVKKSAMRLTMAETIGQTRALAVGAFASLRNAMVRESQTEMRDQMVKAIDAVTQSGAFAVGREDRERKITGDLERRLRAIKQALTLGPLARMRMRDEAMAKLQGLTRDTGLEDDDALCSFRDSLDAQRVIVALSEFGGWRQMGLGQLADLRDKLLRIVQTGMDEHGRQIQRFEERVARLTEPILAALKQNQPETKPGPHSKRSQRLAAWLDEHLGLQNLLFETLLSRATGETRAKGARAVRDLLSAFTEASVTYEAKKQTWQRRAQDIIARHYGSVTAWQKRMREPIDDDHRKRISNRRTERQEQAGEGPAQKTALTRGQVLQLYASVIQPDYALNARLHRRDGDALNAMRDCLSDKDLQFLAEMSAFFREIFPELRDAYKAVTGVTVGTTPGYWPVRIDYEREGLPARVRAWTPIVAAMEPRRRNSLDFREDVSVEDMLWGRIDEWAHMLGYGQMGILVRAVLGDRHLRQEIRNSLGDRLAKRIQDNVLDALLGPETDPGAGFLLVGARYTSGMTMAFNLGVMIKQSSGIPAFAHALGGKKTLRFWWAGLAKDEAYERDWQTLVRSPSFQARYGVGLNAEMKAALAGGEPGGFAGRASRFYSFGLQWQTWADKVICRPFAVGAFREYRDAYLREGMDNAEATRRAVIDAWAMVEATQQSARPENQLRTINKNRVFRWLAQFRSAPLQQLQWEMRAFSAMLRGEEGARARFIRAVMVNHVFAPMFYVALDALWNELLLGGLWSDDDEEKKRRFKRYCSEMALQFLFGQLPAVPLYGNAFEVFYQWLLKNARRKKEGRDLADLTARELAQDMVDIPVVRTEANLAAAAASLVKDLCTLNLRNAASEIDDFAKSALSPYRDIQKAVRNLSGHDLDDLWEEDEAARRQRVRLQMAEAARRNADEE